MDNVETIGLAKIQNLGTVQPDDGHFYLIFDKTGNCANFFNYTGTLVDFNKDIVKVQAGAQTEADALEVLRKAVVGAARHGKTLVVNFESLRPNFRAEYAGTDANLPEWVWNYQQLMTDINKLVRDNENTDHMGGTPFHMNKGFGIIILLNFISDDDVAKYSDKFPYGTELKKFIVE